jgi:hypothetical protein
MLLRLPIFRARPHPRLLSTSLGIYIGGDILISYIYVACIYGWRCCVNCDPIRVTCNLNTLNERVATLTRYHDSHIAMSTTSQAVPQGVPFSLLVYSLLL